MLISTLTSLLTVEIIAELLLQRWAKTNVTMWLVFGMIAYVSLALLFANAMKHANLTTMNTAWQCGNVVIISLIGVFVLKEELSLLQKVGVCLAFLSTSLMFFK